MSNYIRKRNAYFFIEHNRRALSQFNRRYELSVQYTSKNVVCEHIYGEMSFSSDFVNNMVAAAAAGLAARVTCHPIDTCKAKLQSVDTFRGTCDVITRTFKNEGLAGFYKGVGAVLVGGIPGVCLYMTSYETAKSHLSTPQTLGSYPALSYLVSGMIAEAIW